MNTCTCPTVWNGIYPPPCPVHNPPSDTRSLRERVTGRTDIPRIGWSASPCPSRQWAVLGVDEPTLVRCGGIKGHDGEHRLTISWTGPDALTEGEGE